MSDSKSVPKGLKDTECERNPRKSRPPIPYVPVVDEVQDALAKDKKKPLTIRLDDKTSFSAAIWDRGTPEAFLIHVQEALNACTRKGHFRDLEEAEAAIVTSNANLTNLEELIADALSAGVNAPEGSADDLEAARKSLAKAVKKKASAIEGFFAMYANLLSEDMRFPWDKIVKDQVGTASWTNLKGIEQTVVREKSRESFDDCVTFHLLTVFASDAAEQQRFYISNVLKKPARVPVRHFFQPVEQLNGYLAHLPSLYNSPRATVQTKPVAPFDEAELANLLLRMCPPSWNNQYDLIQETVPQSMRKLLSILETIEKCEANSAAQSKPQANGQADKSNSNGKVEKGKRKGMKSATDRIPKKLRSEKHCVLCKEFGGKPDTHNTLQCFKWEKGGKLKSGFGSSGAEKPFKKKAENSAFAQLNERFAKLEKSLKRGKKKSSRKKKRYDSSDSDSDSE